MKKIGIMGCGVVATYGHIPPIAGTDGLQFVAAYDPNPAHLAKVASDYPGIQTFSDSQRFFEDTELDAVVVTSSAFAHLENVLDAAKYGKHVLCEKPLAMTDADATTMIEEMQAAGLMLFTGFCYRFSPCALEIKNLIATQAIGEARCLRLIYNWNLHGRDVLTPDGKLIANPRRVGRMLEGGPMVDCGVHQIDLARWWLDSEVVRHFGVGAWVEDFEAPDHLYLHMDHLSGAHTLVEISYSYGATAKDPLSYFVYEIIGTNGVIRYDREAQIFEVRTATGIKSHSWHEEKNFWLMYSEFRDALHSGNTGHLPSGFDGLIATKIARTATNQAIASRAGKK